MDTDALKDAFEGISLLVAMERVVTLVKAGLMDAKAGRGIDGLKYAIGVARKVQTRIETEGKGRVPEDTVREMATLLDGIEPLLEKYPEPKT